MVFNPAVYAELVDGLHSDQPWDDVADFFRTAPSVIEVESLVAYTIELLEEVRSLLPDLQLPRAAILREPGEWSPEMVELLRHHPDWQGRGVIVPHKRPKDVAIRDWRDSILRVARGEPETLPSRITGWRESVAVTRPYFRTVAKDAIAPEAIIHWMKHANSRGGNEPIRQGPDDRGLDGGDRKGSKQ